jgi:dimethylhistidine N-methyltransferase
MEAEVIAGLSASQKRLPPKYFYDEVGSKLFEAITTLPEYYPTRTELEIFENSMASIADSIGPGVCVVEYGSGSSLKIRKVLEQVEPLAYVPVDISREHLIASATELAADFTELQVYPTCADFTGAFDLPAPVAAMPKVGFFPGSSIGNFDPETAEDFLVTVRETLGAGARLIIGVDLKKDPLILEAAYDDAAGVTARFNLNLLSHLARELDASFDPERFRHRAIYNAEIGAVQMFLDVLESHDVVVGAEQIHFEAGESVHTENSFKFNPEDFVQLAQRAGFSVLGRWTDPRDWYAVYLFEADA